MIYTDYYVYALLDPRKGDQPFYVGKGRGKRWQMHLRENYGETINRHKWATIQAVKKAGLSVGVTMLAENLAESDAYNLEEQTIARFGRKRFDEGGILTNICADSRPPPAFGRILPEEIRRIIAAKCSAKLKGRKCGPYSEAHRAAISAGLRVRAYRHTEECKERARQRLLGTTHPPMPLESRLKLGQARIGSGNPMFGKNHTADAVALIAAAPTVRWNAFAERMKREIEACVREGAVSQKAVMRRLNDKGITTRYGKRWNAMSISYLLSTMGLSMKDFLAEGTSLSGPVPFKGYTAYEQTRRRKPNRCAHRLENNVAAQSKLEI